MADGDKKIVEVALQEWKLCADAESDYRKKALSDLKFRAGDQWPENVKQSRDVEQRPCLTSNRMPQAIRQVTNDARMNRPSIKISPTEDGDVETAEIWEGLCRHIQVASNADVAYDTAMDFSVTMGFGYMRVTTEYSDEMSFDQDIKIKRVKNPFTVYCDPHSVEPDYSDMRYAFVTEDIPKETFKRDYPDAEVLGIDMESIGDTEQDWCGEDTIRIAEYFKVEEKPAKLFKLSNGKTILGESEEKVSIAAQETGLAVVDKRDTTIKTVVWRKITACDVLETIPWAGKYIPIIPVLGEDLDIDGKRELIGMVRYAQDPQRMYNYWITAQTEAIALAPKAPFIGAAGQFENYEGKWASANVKNYAYLEYNPMDIAGNALPPPQRNQAEPPVQAMVQAAGQAAEDIKATTGVYDSSLGRTQAQRSGKAVIAEQKQGDVASFHYIDNLTRAIRHLGVILVDLIPHIYDAPRVVRILGEDNTSKMVKINQPSGEQTQDEAGNPVDKIYDMTSGKYDVVVETGPSYNTKRQESTDTMVQLVQSDPSLMQKAGDIIVGQMDFPMAQELAERLKKTLPPELQDNDKDGATQLPPQVKTKMDQMGQMMEQLTQQLHAKQDELDTKAAELASKERIALEDNKTQLSVEMIKSETANNQAILIAEMKSINERLQILGIGAPVEAVPEVSQQMPQQPPQAPPVQQ